MQALALLEGAKETVEEPAHKLNTINESKELAPKATEAAQSRTKNLKMIGTVNTAWKQELDSVREQYAVAIAELDAAKQEFRRIKKDFESSMEAKLRAFHQEAEAKQLSDVNTEMAVQHSKEIAACHRASPQGESKIRSEKDAARQSYKQALEDTEKKLASFKKEFDCELYKNLEAKPAETTSEIGAIQKEMEDD